MARVDELFDLRYGHSLELNSMVQVEQPEGVNFVGRALQNNGVTARVQTSETPGVAGELTVSLGGNGGVLATFVQPEPFVCGFHVMILSAKRSTMPTAEKIWWALCIYENRYRFSFGRQANRTLGSLVLPDTVPNWVTNAEVPDIESISARGHAYIALTDSCAWAWYEVGTIFNVTRGKYVPKRLKATGPTRSVSSSERNNGVSDHIDLPPEFSGGVIAVSRNGSVGHATFQDRPFFATDDVHVWQVKDRLLDPASGLFLCTIIRSEKFRYSYGRKWSLDAMRETRIKLPQDAYGNPDWDYMSRYMRGLPFSASL